MRCGVPSSLRARLEGPCVQFLLSLVIVHLVPEISILPEGLSLSLFCSVSTCPSLVQLWALCA